MKRLKKWEALTMIDLSNAMKAKSDQLNFVDLGTDGELLITIEHVNYEESRDQQKVWIYYEGCNNRPYKPSLGMVRVLIGAWGKDGDTWPKKSILLYGEKAVTFGKGEVGGIRIRSLSDIPKEGYTAFIQKNKRVRVKQTIPLLVIEAPKPTADDLNWVASIKAGKNKLEDINDKSRRDFIESLLK
jgi:hypothetical protein